MTNTIITINSQLYSSKNSHQIFRNRGTGKPFIVKSSAAKKNEKDLCSILSDNKLKKAWFKLIDGKTPPYNVSFKIYRKTRGHFDYCNIIQNLQDCMVMAGWLVDDDMSNLIPHFEPYSVDKENPRVLITLKDLKEND